MRLDAESETFVVDMQGSKGNCLVSSNGSCPTLLSVRGHDVHCIAFKPSHFTRGKDGAPSPVAPPLSADADKGDQDTVVCAPAVQAFYSTESGRDKFQPPNLSPPLKVGTNSGGTPPAIAGAMAVRRLTTLECCRLQGFPDTYLLDVPCKRRRIAEDEASYLAGHGIKCWQDKGQWYTNASADGPMYRALGNSMCVNVMRWIGERIAAVDAEREVLANE